MQLHTRNKRVRSQRETHGSGEFSTHFQPTVLTKQKFTSNPGLKSRKIRNSPVLISFVVQLVRFRQRSKNLRIKAAGIQVQSTTSSSRFPFDFSSVVDQRPLVVNRNRRRKGETLTSNHVTLWRPVKFKTFIVRIHATAGSGQNGFNTTGTVKQNGLKTSVQMRVKSNHPLRQLFKSEKTYQGASCLITKCRWSRKVRQVTAKSFWYARVHSWVNKPGRFQSATVGQRKESSISLIVSAKVVLRDSISEKGLEKIGYDTTKIQMKHNSCTHLTRRRIFSFNFTQKFAMRGEKLKAHRIGTVGVHSRVFVSFAKLQSKRSQLRTGTSNGSEIVTSKVLPRSIKFLGPKSTSKVAVSQKRGSPKPRNMIGQPMSPIAGLSNRIHGNTNFISFSHHSVGRRIQKGQGLVRTFNQQILQSMSWGIHHLIVRHWRAIKTSIPNVMRVLLFHVEKFQVFVVELVEFKSISKVKRQNGSYKKPLSKNGPKRDITASQIPPQTKKTSNGPKRDTNAFQLTSVQKLPNLSSKGVKTRRSNEKVAGVHRVLIQPFKSRTGIGIKVGQRRAIQSMTQSKSIRTIQWVPPSESQIGQRQSKRVRAPILRHLINCYFCKTRKRQKQQNLRSALGEVAAMNSTEIRREQILQKVYFRNPNLQNGGFSFKTYLNPWRARKASDQTDRKSATFLQTILESYEFSRNSAKSTTPRNSSNVLEQLGSSPELRKVENTQKSRKQKFDQHSDNDFNLDVNNCFDLRAPGAMAPKGTKLKTENYSIANRTEWGVKSPHTVFEWFQQAKRCTIGRTRFQIPLASASYARFKSLNRKLLNKNFWYHKGFTNQNWDSLSLSKAKLNFQKSRTCQNQHVQTRQSYQNENKVLVRFQGDKRRSFTKLTLTRTRVTLVRNLKIQRWKDTTVEKLQNRATALTDFSTKHKFSLSSKSMSVSLKSGNFTVVSTKFGLFKPDRAWDWSFEVQVCVLNLARILIGRERIRLENALSLADAQTHAEPADSSTPPPAYAHTAQKSDSHPKRGSKAPHFNQLVQSKAKVGNNRVSRKTQKLTREMRKTVKSRFELTNPSPEDVLKKTRDLLKGAVCPLQLLQSHQKTSEFKASSQTFRLLQQAAELQQKLHDERKTQTERENTLKQAMALVQRSKYQPDESYVTWNRRRLTLPKLVLNLIYQPILDVWVLTAKFLLASADCLILGLDPITPDPIIQDHLENSDSSDQPETQLPETPENQLPRPTPTLNEPKSIKKRTPRSTPPNAKRRCFKSPSVSPRSPIIPSAGGIRVPQLSSKKSKRNRRLLIRRRSTILGGAPTPAKRRVEQITDDMPQLTSFYQPDDSVITKLPF